MNLKFARSIAATLSVAFMMTAAVPAFADNGRCDDLQKYDLPELQKTRKTMDERTKARDEVAASLKSAKTGSTVSKVIGIPAATLGVALDILAISMPLSTTGGFTPVAKQALGGGTVVAAGGVLWIYLKHDQVKKLEALLSEASELATRSEERFEEDRAFLIQKWVQNGCPGRPAI